MRILIIGPSWVGDTIIAQGLFKKLKETYPESSIDVLAPEWTLSLLDRMKEVSNSILLPFLHGDLLIKRRWNLGRNLKDTYDWVLILPNSLKSTIVPLAANIPKRTGWLGELRHFLLNDTKKLVMKDHPLMIQRFCALANNFQPVGDDYNFPSLEVDVSNIDRISKEYDLDFKNNPIILCPGAEFGPAKRWPTKKYAEVGDHYLDLGKQVLLIGSKKDMLVCAEVAGNMKLEKESSFFDLSGKTSLLDVVDIISQGTVISNDSGLMHVAAAVGSYQVALFGPTDPEFTPPLNVRAKILRKSKGYSKVREGKGEHGYHESLLEISSIEVIDEIDNLIKKI
ncbi:MAG: lipopolysaccharide heptosyltransferase II [SAR86 cluster bacterium]|jgi:heptosyltransferase II|nr:lipopolysaccharide heptosyltransferase II [SAR86 cluster bacterium]